MMRFGTTTCEAKSGYGLALEHELKQLRAIRRLQEEHPMDVTATFMGAHLVPAEYKQDRAEYIRLVCEEMMPAVKEQASPNSVMCLRSGYLYCRGIPPDLGGWPSPWPASQNSRRRDRGHRRLSAGRGNRRDLRGTPDRLSS